MNRFQFFKQLEVNHRTAAVAAALTVDALSREVRKLGFKIQSTVWHRGINRACRFSFDSEIQIELNRLSRDSEGKS
jgi:hypothetical protein